MLGALFINQCVLCQCDNTGAGVSNSKQSTGRPDQRIGDNRTAVTIRGTGGDANSGADLSILSNVIVCGVGVGDATDRKFIDINDCNGQSQGQCCVGDPVNGFGGDGVRRVFFVVYASIGYGWHD